ncbi:MAG: L,D-transpeptidase family protein [Chitinophagaceae bacterium]
MKRINPRYPLYTGIVICLALLCSCGSKKQSPSQLVSTPEELNAKSAEIIASYCSEWSSVAGEEPDTVLNLRQPRMVSGLYEQLNYGLVWSGGEKWKPGADSLITLIGKARLYGLFPSDYHHNELEGIRAQMLADSLSQNARKNPELWSRADLWLTDAFIQVTRDVKLGRIPNDSISLNKDSVIRDSFYLQQLRSLPVSGTITSLLQALEPRHWGYQRLKQGIMRFLEKADFRTYAKVPSPAKKDPGFKRALQHRLYEGGYLQSDSLVADSVQLAGAIKKFQQDKDIATDGIAGEATVRMLNLSDHDKFIRIAISMDKYKKFPAEMPSKYIWVNASSNYLQVISEDSIRFSSRVITGKARTRTPLLNGAVSVLITYPQWVPPPSIVTKEILPALKKNPGYLARKGFSLLDREGNEVDPFTVDWSKYSKGVPYRIVQGSGDANALGVLKFHFDNKYSVYLHDTNQRYLFNQAARSLSHGCVRVQEWEKLALFLLGPQNRMADTLQTWLKNKEKHHLGLKNKVPVFIRYFTCEGKDGQIQFYDDVYGDDQYLAEKYFARKDDR